MPYTNVESIHARAVAVQQSAPAEVLCAPSEASASGDADAPAGVVARREKAASPRRAEHPPLRSSDEVMRAFREERRLTQEAGQASAVILQIIARTGRGSLLGDLTKKEGP